MSRRNRKAETEKVLKAPAQEASLRSIERNIVRDTIKKKWITFFIKEQRYKHKRKDSGFLVSSETGKDSPQAILTGRARI